MLHYILHFNTRIHSNILKKKNTKLRPNPWFTIKYQFAFLGFLCEICGVRLTEEINTNVLQKQFMSYPILPKHNSAQFFFTAPL